MKQPVDNAIQAWKQAESRIPGEKLSAGTRATILAHARSGHPDKVLATLALHPCLADDPGALFTLNADGRIRPQR